jgi:DNA modification methylase
MMKTLNWRHAMVMLLGAPVQYIHRVQAHVLLEALRYHSVDLIILDPPSLIGVGESDNEIDTTVDEHVAALVPVADQVARVLKFGGVVVVMGEPVVLSAWDMVASWSGLRFAGDLAVLWDESGGETIDHAYSRELSVRRRAALLKPSDSPSLFTNIRWYNKPGYRLSFDPARSIVLNTNVLVCRRVPMIYRHHVTQRPVELFNYLIQSFTRPGELVVDPYCGSGSSLVAARMNDRRWLGGDREQDQCRLARKRVMKSELEEAYLQPLLGWKGGKTVKIEG